MSNIKKKIFAEIMLKNSFIFEEDIDLLFLANY